MIYISHARTPEELKLEVCSDLQRRLAFIDGQISLMHKSRSEVARLNCAKIEIENLLRYYKELIIIRPKRRRSPGITVSEEPTTTDVVTKLRTGQL